MDANVVFRAYAIARNEMERDLAKRAEHAFIIPATPTEAEWGIGIAHDENARSWQHHKRQMEKFETRMRHIVALVDGITYPENVGKARLKNPWNWTG